MVIQTILRINVLAYRNGFGLSLMKTWNVNIFRENNNAHMVPGRGDLLWVLPLQFPRKPAEGRSGECGYQSRRVPTGPAARVSPSLALCSHTLISWSFTSLFWDGGCGEQWATVAFGKPSAVWWNFLFSNCLRVFKLLSHLHSCRLPCCGGRWAFVLFNGWHHSCRGSWCKIPG